MQGLKEKIRGRVSRLLSGQRGRPGPEAAALEEDLRDSTEVIHELIETHYPGLPLPPEPLRLHVGMKASPAHFWVNGIRSSSRVLEVFGRAPEAPILDWGCGPGRSLLWLLCHEAYRRQYHGCDVDREAIDWVKQQGPFRVQVCTDSPPLPYQDLVFGGLFGFSILSHIRPERHREWYAELRRVLKPGGIAYLTTLGSSIILDPHPSDRFPQPCVEEFRSRGSTYVANEGHYKGAAIVSEEFTRQAVEGLFTVVEYRPKGYTGYRPQDSYLLRRDS